ncbi:hypothetical protein, partial [Viridibacillus arvi]|uniref:hypothetical protein n=1 Tax=Viridibacillus arvi TaxID=263475 RepID=UPI0034CF6626
ITVTPQIDGDYNEDHAVSKVFTTLKVEEDMPTVLNVTATTSNKDVIVKWDAFEYKGVKSTRYRVQRYIKLEDGTFEKDGFARATTTNELVVTGLTAGNEYYFEVTPQVSNTYKDEFNGISNKISFELPPVDVVKPVTNVVASINEKTAEVTWDEYTIKGNTSTRYRVQVYEKDPTTGELVKKGAAVTVSENSYFYNKLEDGKTYQFMITPQANGTYNEAYSTISNEITFALQPVEVLPGEVVGPKITNVVASINEKTAEITWDEFTIKGNTSTRYRVQAYEKDIATGELVRKGTAVAVNGNSYAYNKLVEGKTYQFMITPQANGTYNESYSTLSNEVTYGVRATFDGTSVMLDWAEVADVTRYKVEKYKYNETLKKYELDGYGVSTEKNTHAFSDLEENTKYKFVIIPRLGYVYDTSSQMTTTMLKRNK